MLAHDGAPPPSLPSEALATSEAEEVLTAYDFWNEFAKKHDLPQAIKLTDERRNALAARIEDAGGLDEFEKVIESIAESAFLRGYNDRNWRASLDWILEEAHFVRLREGSYHDAPTRQFVGI